MTEPLESVGGALGATKEPCRCACGCGDLTPSAKSNDSRRGRRKGQPCRYIKGHHRRKPDRHAVTDTGYKTPCWICKLARDPAGYGKCRSATGKVSMAHRVSYEEHVGHIPHGRQLDHLCRMPACVNPAHLEPVSSAENVRRGLRTKLDIRAVEEICASTETQAVLARRYGVGQPQISRIKSGKSWALRS
jgi:hypothetical protein